MMNSSFNNIVKGATAVMMVALLCIVGACSDDDIVNDHGRHTLNSDGTLSFSIEIPGYAVPTRADGQVSIDTLITTLDLFLFDERGGFIGIVSAEKKDENTTIDSGEKDDIYDTDFLNGQGEYKASIPQNTEIVHFIANAPAALQNLDMNHYKGLSPEEVIVPMVTTGHLYWGTSTYAELQQKTFDEEPVILYRNYAKVTWEWTAPTASVADEEGNVATPQIVSIDGWTLCNVPQNATVAPFDADAIGETKGPFHFNLADENSRYACVPVADRREDLVSGTENDMVTTASGSNLPQPLSIFDHTVEAYGKRVFAIFKITTQKGTDATTKKPLFYKIELLKDTKENGIVVSRTPFDIKRNHIYTIKFNGINSELGKESFDEAVEGPAANNSLVEVEETLPELQSNTSVLRVENGTVRYIDNLATKYTTTATATIDGTSYTAYNVNDIQIYYSGPYDIVAEWVTDSCHYSDGNGYVPETSTDSDLKLQLKTQQDVNGRYTHIVSFYADEFAQGDNGTKHYKEGLIRIRETGAGALSRFVRVYIGDPISFRPLLWSSDIPAMPDERLTVAFKVPNEDYLPTSLYPIEVRFGSNRIDVEKNLYVDAMKVDLNQTEDYTHVYQYEQVGDTWAWNADADNVVKNEWGYKYTYTIETPADSGEHRITLRTVSTNGDVSDFSVMMEGLSTVLLNGTRSTDEADIFNTRELRFKVQQANKTDATARRIMLNDGLYDTRMTTAYINVTKGTQSVDIDYTLGFFDTENNQMTSPTGDNFSSATLWVYYHPEDLTPSGEWAMLNDGKPFVDAEGNHFAKVTATTTTGELSFNIKNPSLQNSLVFITARSGDGAATGTHPYGGTYTGKALGEESHVYTGVNTDANAWRSASALVSVLSNWKFNPAVKNSEGNYEYTDEFEKKYGAQNTMDTHDFIVRIDRPANTTNTISIDTEGKLQLIADENSPYELLGTYETITSDDKTYTYYRSSASNISLKLKNKNDVFCELTFRPVTFDHTCTITFSDGGTDNIYDESEKNTLKLTHTPIPIYSNKYMWLDEYNAKIENELVADALFASSFNVDPIVGQEYVARIYFLKSEINGVFSAAPEAFTFKFSSNCSEVQTANTNSKSDNYEIFEDGTIQVTKGFKETLTINGEEYGYVDLILKTVKDASSETMRISTADSPATGTENNVTVTADNPIKFYRYSVSGFGNRVIYEAGSDKVKYELSTDNTNWVTLQHNGIYLNTNEAISDDLYQKGQTAYLRVTYPLANNDNNVVNEFTLTTSGFFVETPTGATKTVYNQNNVIVTNPTESSNNYCYYWTYKLGNITTKDNSFTLTLKTIGYGLADLMKAEGHGFTFTVNPSQFSLATETDSDNDGYWEISKYTGTSAPSAENNRTGEDHAIFDVGTQINGVPDDTYSSPADYTHASKMDGAACISFYAPYTGMKLNVGLSQRKNKGGTLDVWYNGEKDNTYAANTPTSTDAISDFEYTLGAPGLYQLKGSGSEFFLYYLKLQKQREAYTGAIITTWSAKKLDDSQMTNATWGGTGTALGTDNLIYLSDFAEKLVLTVDLPENETEATLTLFNTGKYAFRNADGTKVYSYTVTDGGTIELVPASDTDTEIVEGTDIIQLTGYSTNYTYSQNITVKVIPWVELTTDLYEKYTTTNTAGYPIMQVGDQVSMTFTLTDEQHVGKTVQFGLREYETNNSLQLESHGGTVLTEATKDAYSTFIWKAVSSTTRTLFQVRGYSTTSDYPPTDVVYDGSILDDGNKAQLFDLAIEGISITYTMGDETAEGVLPEGAVIGSGESYTLPTKNFTLYKEGHTLTGWSDGTTTYAPGTTITPSANITLTPVFTQNSVSLSDRSAEVTITWDFQQKNGAPIVGWEGTNGHVWVAQATVTKEDGTTGTIDVKMDVNTTNGGKFNNASWQDWAQINGGTILTIPSCMGATVKMESYSATTNTTIAGETINQGTTTPTYNCSNSAYETDIVIGDGTYWKYVTVTLPVVTYAHTATYYKDGYPSTDVYTTQGYEENATLTLPSSNPSVTNREFSHWVTVEDGGDGTHRTRTTVSSGETVSADMSIYPVYTALIGATANTIRPGDIIQVSGCYTKNSNQIIDSSRDGHYVLFKVKPQTTGWYSFTSAMGTRSEDVSITLGYLNGDDYAESEKINITNTDSYTSTNDYTWGFYLNEGTTYTFKMLCHKATSGYCVNAYTMTVQQMTVTDKTNVIPTTSAYPFTLTNGELTGSQANYASGDHIDYMYSGDYATYDILNAKNTKYQIEFSAATTQASITVTFSLTNSSGTVVWSGESNTITSSGDNTWDKYNPYTIEVDKIIPTGIYTLKIVFNDNDSNSGNGTTCNLKNITFTAKE